MSVENWPVIRAPATRKIIAGLVADRRIAVPICPDFDQRPDDVVALPLVEELGTADEIVLGQPQLPAARMMPSTRLWFASTGLSATLRSTSTMV